MRVSTLLPFLLLLRYTPLAQAVTFGTRSSTSTSTERPPPTRAPLPPSKHGHHPCKWQCNWQWGVGGAWDSDIHPDCCEYCGAWPPLEPEPPGQVYGWHDQYKRCKWDCKWSTFPMWPDCMCSESCVPGSSTRGEAPKVRQWWEIETQEEFPPVESPPVNSAPVQSPSAQKRRGMYGFRNATIAAKAEDRKS